MQANTEFRRTHFDLYQWIPGRGLRRNCAEFCYRLAQELHFETALPMRSWAYRHLVRLYRKHYI